MPTLNIEDTIGRLSIEPAFFDSFEIELMPAQDGDSSGLLGDLEEIVNHDSVRRASVMKYATRFLDRTLPLDGVSHADVVRYTVEIPTRYARCFGVLADGRKIPFIKLRKFIGWSGHDNKRSLLFQDSGLHIEIQTDADRHDGYIAPGQIRDVTLESSAIGNQHCDRRFIGIDGRRMLLPA